MKQAFNDSLTAPIGKTGFGLEKSALDRVGTVKNNGHSSEITHGAVVIAAITSCTNTSNPSVMIGAGLLAKEGGRTRIEGGLACEDQPGAGFARRHRVS